MKKLKQAIVLMLLLIIALILMTKYYVVAYPNINVDDYISKANLSEAFKKWVGFPEEKKSVVIQPKIYEELNTPFSSQNPLYQINLVGATLNSRYDLRDIIKDNLAIKNQYDTGMCWAFSGLSSLETNLALNNYYLGINQDKVYDFSERHANYSVTREFANGEDNIFGFNRKPSSGGQWFLLENYLTNGQGAIDEVEMPFENNEDVIDIKEIQNKTVKTQVNDTIYFDNYNNQTPENREKIMNDIKQHIQNYGSVFATIHGDSLSSISDNCFNNFTGAKYCNDSETHEIDHAVSIIGWDDNYSVENFSEEIRPSSNGAWITRNSWGETIEYTIDEFKNQIFDSYRSECIESGWNTAQEIPDSFIIENGYVIDGNNVYVSIGDDGYMYVSYEDCNIGETMYGITSALDGIDYDYIYQYDELYPGLEITFSSNSTYICNVFEKKSDETEYLTGVSLTTPETYNCKVYVNPNGSEKTKSDLQFIKLKAGDSETIDKGYHTLEFAEPLEITGETFAVAIEITGTRDTVDIVIEGKIDGIDEFDYTRTEVEKCFVSSSSDLDDCTWFDLGKLEEASSRLTNGDSSIKAFTKTSIVEETLTGIEIETQPTKTSYIEGENFDKSGMVVKALFSDGTYKILSDADYSISGGTNLQYGQAYVTIVYLDKKVEQEITVDKKIVEEPPKEEPKKEEEKAENSDMKNATCVLNNIQAYYYSTNSSKNYSLIDVEIRGISRNMENDSYEYFYYLSSNANLKNITDWVKIDEAQTNNNVLNFRIDSRDISNYNEISKATKLYIYIKESVVKGGNQSVALSPVMLFEMGNVNVDTFIDNAKKQDNNSNNNAVTNNNNNNNGGNSGSSGTQGTTLNSKSSQTQIEKQNEDITKSPLNLPYTGSILIFILIVTVIVGIVIFIRYEILNKYVK